MKGFLLSDTSCSKSTVSINYWVLPILWWHRKMWVIVDDTWAAALLFEPRSFYHSSDLAERSQSFFFPLQVELSNPKIPTGQITSPDHLLVWDASSGAWSERCCPRVLSQSKDTLNRLQYCPEHLVLLTSKPQKNYLAWACPHGY